VAQASEHCTTHQPLRNLSEHFWHLDAQHSREGGKGTSEDQVYTCERLHAIRRPKLMFPLFASPFLLISYWVIPCKKAWSHYKKIKKVFFL
jgi:hypothetical protein